MPGGRKQTFVIGGMGQKPDKNFRQVSPGKFTKQSRCHKPILQHQTRVNNLDMTDTRLVPVSEKSNFI